MARDISRAQALFLRWPDKLEIGKQPARCLAGFCFFYTEKNKTGQEAKKFGKDKKEIWSYEKEYIVLGI